MNITRKRGLTKIHLFPNNLFKNNFFLSEINAKLLSIMYINIKHYY